MSLEWGENVNKGDLEKRGDAFMRILEFRYLSVLIA